MLKAAAQAVQPLTVWGVEILTHCAKIFHVKGPKNLAFFMSLCAVRVVR